MKICVTDTMCRRLLLTGLVVCAFFHGRGAGPDALPCADMGMAREWCDTHRLDNLEGIWTIPSDNVTVLISRDRQTGTSSAPSYLLTVVETDDVRLRPAERMGELAATPQANVYSLHLYTRRSKGVLGKPKACVATLSADGEGMTVRGDKTKFNLRFLLNPSTLLPGFWKLLRVNAGLNPLQEGTAPPEGLIKVYPSYDGNGSSRRVPRYL